MESKVHFLIKSSYEKRTYGAEKKLLTTVPGRSLRARASVGRYTKEYSFYCLLRFLRAVFGSLRHLLIENRRNSDLSDRTVTLTKEIMKKRFMPLAAMVVFALSSCHSTRNVAVLPSADFNGEWNIVEVNGSAINLKDYPYIGFDTENGRIYGNTGCNNVMGSFDLNSKPGTLELGKLASTMMAGPNMDVERNVLNALGQVKGYLPVSENEIALCNEKKRPVVILKKRNQTMALNELSGKWNILAVNGKEVPGDVEKQPFLHFDVAARKVSGCAGCNNIHGGFTVDAAQSQSIAFPALASTRMMCADMELENSIMQALNAVRSYGRLGNGHLALYADGKLVLELAEVK